MSAITYTAVDRGSLANGRVAGSAYIFDVGLNLWDLTTTRKKTQAISLSGSTETILHRLDRVANVATAPISDDDLIDQMREFLDSVAGGEPFIIDKYGSVATPDNPVIASIEDDYREQRIDLSFTSFNFKIKL